MNLSFSEYIYKNCSYEAIQPSPETKAQKCITVAQGICNPTNNYLNLYSLYYCHLNGSDSLYITFTIIAVIWLLTMLNYIRRTFFVPPLMKLRRVLGISSNIAEKTILPFSYGIVPFIVRIQGAYQGLPSSFNFGATLGGILALGAFSFGVCAIVVGRSKKVVKKDFILDIFFCVLGIALFMLFGFEGRVKLWHGIVMIGIWVSYIVSIFLSGYGEEEYGKYFNFFLLVINLF